MMQKDQSKFAVKDKYTVPWRIRVCQQRLLNREPMLWQLLMNTKWCAWAIQVTLSHRSSGSVPVKDWDRSRTNSLTYLDPILIGDQPLAATAPWTICWCHCCYLDNILWLSLLGGQTYFVHRNIILWYHDSIYKLFKLHHMNRNQ
jgi:hypothetical protein